MKNMFIISENIKYQQRNRNCEKEADRISGTKNFHLKQSFHMISYNKNGPLHAVNSLFIEVKMCHIAFNPL